MANDNELVIRINGNIRGYQDALNAARQQTEAFQGQVNTIAKTGAIAFAGFGAAILLAANTAGKFETIGVQFEVVTGSVEEAQKTLEKLSDFAAKTPFQFPGIAQSAKQLIAFGITGEDLIPTLTRIGDVSAATGAEFKDLTLIFGQVKAAGKLTGERLLQLEERAIPIGPALAKTMGVAESAIRDLVSKGEVDFKTFEKAFKSLSDEGGLAFQGMAKSSQTFEGQLSTLSDNFELVTAAVGKNFLPVLKKLTAAFINVLEFIRENPGLTDFIAKILIAGTVTGGLLTTLALGITIFLKLRAAIIASTIATRGLSFAVKGLVGATGIGLLIAFLPEIIELFQFVFEGSLEIVKRVGRSLASLAVGYAQILKGIFTFNPAEIQKGLARIGDAFTDARFKAEETRKQNIEDAKKEQEELAKIEAQKVKDLAAANKEKEKLNKVEFDKKKQALIDERVVLTAQLAGIEKETVAFLKRRLELRNKTREAEAIQDETRRSLAVGNIKLLNKQIDKEEEEANKKRLALSQAKLDKDTEIEEKEVEMAAKKIQRAADIAAKEEEQTQQRIEKLATENEILKAHEEEKEQIEIDFLQRSLDLKSELSEAEKIKDDEERTLAIENNKLKNDQLLADEGKFLLDKALLKADQQEIEDTLNTELNKLSAEQRAALNQADIDQLRATIKTKADIEAKAAKDKALANMKEQKKFLADKKKFGIVTAKLNKLFRSEEFKAAESGVRALTQLQESGNDTLKGIGKTAALVQVGIDTAKGAVAANASFASLGPIGAALGAAAAAAIVVFGVERANKIRAAQAGGFVTGSGFGDTQPFLLEPGELITPRQNFEEVVTAVSNQRAARIEAEEGGTVAGFGETNPVDVNLIIDFASQEAADMITVRQNEERALGISQDTMGR